MIPTSDNIRDRIIAQEIVDLEAVQATFGVQYIDPATFDALTQRLYADLRAGSAVPIHEPVRETIQAVTRIPGAIAQIPGAIAETVRGGVTSAGNVLATLGSGVRTTGVVLAVALLGVGLIAAAKAIRA